MANPLMSVGQRLVTLAMNKLPPSALRRLSGGGEVRRDGLTLDPDAQFLLRLLALSGNRGVAQLEPAAARAEMRRAIALAPAVEGRMSVGALSIPGPAGPIPARLYRPDVPGPRPLVVFFHGGGWVLGDLDTHDGGCRFLARESGANVLAVDYRLAPEHRFPAAVEDAFAALRWAMENTARLEADPARIAVAGDSAGGNLAAVVAQLAARAGGPGPAVQLLIYPVTDLSTKHPSYHFFSEGFLLNEADMDWFKGHYLPWPAAALDPKASPLLAVDLAGLPPAIVLTAGFDPLRDEGEAYAARLEAAGVRVHLRRAEGQVHGFFNLANMLPRAREGALWGIARLRQEFDRAGDAARAGAGRPSPAVG